MATFVGTGLALEALTLIGPATVRVTFTQEPLEANPAGAHDALNPSLWSITGAGLVSVSSCAVVSGDPRSVDLLLSAPLPAGTWTVTASSAIQTAGANPLQDPKFLSLVVTGTGNTNPVNGNAENDDAESLLHKHFNPALKGKYWDALIAAIATGDTTNNENAELAVDQMFKSTASGKYLDQRSGDDGFPRPPGIGLSDDLFRDLSITVTDDKLVQNVLLEILEIYYGPESVRAYADSTLTQSFALSNGDDLRVLLDEEDAVTVVFKQADFNQIAQASAAEVAAAITRAFEKAGLEAWAVAHTNPAGGLVHVRIYSQTLGLKSSVRVTGGRAQNFLQFPTLDPASKAGGMPTYVITYNAGTQTARFTVTGAGTILDLTAVQVGDYVNVYGTEFNAGNRGSFTVTNVSVSYPGGTLTQWFEIVNASAVAESVAQLVAGNVLYFRPTRLTIQNQGPRPAFVAQGGGQLDVVLPATTQVVGRAIGSGAYLHSQVAVVADTIVRDMNGLVTVTANGHGVPNDGKAHQVWIDGALGGNTAPTVGFGGAGFSGSSIQSAWYTISTGTATSARYLTVTKLLDNRAVAIGGENSTPTIQNRIEEFYISGVHGASPNFSYDYTYTANGTLAVAREWHTAVLLLDPRWKGSVSVYGGQDAAGGVLNVVGQVYTPGAPNSGAGTLTNSQAMTTPRSGHAATFMTSNNKVVMSGGINTGTTVTATVELFDPATLNCSVTGALNQGRAAHQQVLLGTGKVLAMGGKTGAAMNSLSSGTALATCELYDPVGATWAYTGRMTYARFGFGAAVLPDGKVLVAGGYGQNPVFGGANALILDCELYNPATGTWSWAGKLAAGHDYPTLTVIDGKVYVYCGINVGDTEYYDIKTGRWHISPASLNFGRGGGRGVLMDQNQIAVIGGLKGAATGPDHQLFIPGSEHFRSGGLNGMVAATRVDANTFTYSTPGNTDYASVSVLTSPLTTSTRAAAPAGGAQLGPFTYEPEAGVALTGSQSTTTADIGAGAQLQTLAVADATKFPDAPGYLVLAFGYANQVGPVKYLGRYSTTALLLDASYTFPSKVLSGSTVNLLVNKEPFVPANPEDVGTFYATASNAGLAAAKKTVGDTVAGGFDVEYAIEYPGDRGLGNEGRPAEGSYKLSDKVRVWGSDDLDEEVAALEEA